MALLIGRTPAELEATMSAREFSEYQALFQIQPYGPFADDIRSARICATIANFSGNIDWKKRGNKAFQPADFLPALEKPEPQTPSAQAQLVKTVNRMLGGKKRKRGESKSRRNG